MHRKEIQLEQDLRKSVLDRIRYLFMPALPEVGVFLVFRWRSRVMDTLLKLRFID